MNEALDVLKLFAGSRKRAGTSVIALVVAVIYALREDQRYERLLAEQRASGKAHTPIPIDERTPSPRRRRGTFGADALGIGLPLF